MRNGLSEFLIGHSPGIYSDIGSGTQAKGRRRFNAMISACQRGKIDTILTKSAHRFARNTVDALETIRMLRRWKVDIYFEIEGIHSLYESFGVSSGGSLR